LGFRRTGPYNRAPCAGATFPAAREQPFHPRYRKAKALSERYFQHTFPNGLTLLVERMPGVQSAAMTFLLDAGGATDPVDRSGSATVLSDLVLRGAGERDSRTLTAYLDSLGLQRSSSVGVHHARFGSAALAARVMEAIPTYADIVRRPHLPPDGFEAARDLALQSLEGIEDEPRQKLMIKLREWHFPSPFGRNTMGDKEQLEKLTPEAAKIDWQRRYRARNAILALAGNVDFNEAKDVVGKAFGDWQAGDAVDIPQTPPPGNYRYEAQQSEQTHIGLAYPAVPETHEDYYTLRLAMEVLSGGMSGRLFTEIREKRGLVYNVSAGYSSLKGIGSIFGYAGTSNDRAQATLDQFVAELYRLQEGVTSQELERAKTGLKASTIMQGESTSARAGAIAHDYFIRGRIRTLDEVKAAIDGVTLDQVNAFLKKNKAGPFTIVIVGPKELKLPG
jgi:predicted Zn-dependent peptidase